MLTAVAASLFAGVQRFHVAQTKLSKVHVVACQEKQVHVVPCQENKFALPLVLLSSLSLPNFVIS